MRKILIYIVSIALVVVAVLMVCKGVSFGKIQVNSYSAISEENKKLNNLISEANNQKESVYNKRKEGLNSAYKLLESNKESYQQLLEIGVDSNGVPLSKIQEYEIETIWIDIGNYAKKEGVDTKMDITVNNSVSGTYDLNFTVVGTYSSIEDFLRDLQGDNTLIFKIENFKLVAGGENNSADADNSESLTATFVCKDIKLNIVENTSTDDSNTDGSSQTTTQSTTQSTTQATTSSTTQSTTQTN